jgi:hypothetical protein
MKEPPISSPQGGALRLFSLSGADFRTHDPGPKMTSRFLVLIAGDYSGPCPDVQCRCVYRKPYPS